MTIPALERSLLEAISCKDAATEIISSFRAANRSLNLSCSDLDHLRRLFLCAAVEHDHRDLLELLLVEFSTYLNGNPRPLFVAIRSGNLALVEILIKAGSTINAIGSDRVDFAAASAVEMSCVFDQVEILAFLLGPSTEQRSYSCQCALHYACYHGAFKCLKHLLTTDVGRADVNAFKYIDYLDLTLNKTNRLVTPALCDPCLPGNDIINQNLVNPNRPERCSPLMLGVRHGSRMVTELLNAGASVSYQTRSRRQTILHVALEVEPEDLTHVLRMLVDAGAILDGRDVNGNTALNLVIEKANNSEQTAVDCARLLLESGAHQDSNDRYAALQHLATTVNGSKFHNHVKWASSSQTEMDAWKRRFHLSVELVVLLYSHEINEVFDSSSGKPSACGENEANMLMFMVLILLRGKDKLARIAQIDSEDIVTFEVIMNGLCEVLRYCLLSGNKFIVYNNMQYLLPSLLRHSSEQCARFMSLLLAAMDEGHWSKLKKAFASDAPTLAFVQSVEVPSRLKDVARRAIVRAMGQRAIRGTRTLDLPRNLLDFVLCVE